VKIAVAGVPGAWSSEALASSLRDTGADAFVFSLGDVVHDIGRGVVTLGGVDLAQMDAIVLKKLGRQADASSRLRLHALRALESGGVRVFSPVDVIDRAMDRYRMTMILVEAGLPIPPTFAAESGGALHAAISVVGDSVVKPVYTSKGRGMVRVDAEKGADVEALIPPSANGDHQSYLVQRFIEAPGRDIGATVVGGRFIGAFYRMARDGEWMTTTDAGGSYAPCALSDLGIDYAERAAAAFGLDYTVVDLVEQGGDFLLYEVSAFGGFRGLKEASHVDAAAAYAMHIVRSVKG
jgi:tetrahydromethanopterin:alpha-L-glutamate ligase